MTIKEFFEEYEIEVEEEFKPFVVTDVDEVDNIQENKD